LGENIPVSQPIGAIEAEANQPVKIVEIILKTDTNNGCKKISKKIKKNT
jgi:hypothetical protein